MIRARLLSSHLTRDACKSIHGVFHRTLDSGLGTLSRVIRGGGGSYSPSGHGTVNPNNRMISNISIRGLASLSRDDIKINPKKSSKTKSRAAGVSDADFQKGFEDWCEDHGKSFSSEEERRDMFKWFCDTYYSYGRHFHCGRRSPPISSKMAVDAMLEKLSLIMVASSNRSVVICYTGSKSSMNHKLAVYYSDDPPMNELDEFEDKCAFTGRYIDNAQRQLDIESDT
ncbi:hypothetical protein OROHE_016120 [Orobanche hederae]